MKQEGWWKTWREARSLSQGRKIVFFGRSEDWVQKSLLKIGRPVECIVDSNTSYHDTQYHGLPVRAPNILFSGPKYDTYVIITAGPYEGIVATLLEHGLQPGSDFCCCPEYYDFQLLEYMRNYQQRVIVSCSDYLDKTHARYSRAGGGLYRYHIGPNKMDILVPGQFRQIEKVGDSYFAIEYVEMKVYVLDTEFNVITTYPLDRPNYCGIAYDAKRDIVVVANSTTDELSVHERDGFKLINRVPYSRKASDGLRSPHHLNDVTIDGDYLYVSYFSHTGGWRKGQYDGGISEYHLDRLSDGPSPMAGGLWSPHSPKIFEGNLCYLDSMRGRLHVSNQSIAAEFPGFARGLAYDGNFYYVGMSEDMYLSRVYSQRNCIMMNAGFYMLDLMTRAARFYPMLDNMNIHDLMVLDAPQ